MKSRDLCLWVVLAALVPCAPASAERIARDEGAMVADFDGDGKADLAFRFDGGTWRIDYAANGFGAWDWSGGGWGDFHWRPVPADYDGDGKADISVKTDDGAWLIDYARDGFGTEIKKYSGYGDASAHPVPADYDGDGKADLAIKTDGGQWFIDYASDGFGRWNAIYSGYGGPDAHPVPADYDGDRRADLSIKSDGGGWFIDYASDGFGRWNAIYSGYGPETSRPLAADFDRDGKADLAIKEDCGRYYIDLANGGFGAWNLQAAEASMYDNERTVTTAAELKDALTSDFVGSVWVAPPEGVIDLTGEMNLPLRSCVWLRGRREGTRPAPEVTTSDISQAYPLFMVEGNRVRVEGLDLVGPQRGRRDASLPGVYGVVVYVDGANHRGFDLVVANNEIQEWTGGGVRVEGQVFVNDPADVPPGTPLLTKDTPGIPWVWGNYIHDNARDEGGYGVETEYGGYARIEANVFDYNRHAVSSGPAAHTGYLAFHNLVLQGGYPEGPAGFEHYNQHFDVHGSYDGYGGGAGEYFEIAYNTIRGEQDYALGTVTRPAFMLRGRPAVGAFFHDNVDVHDTLLEAIKLSTRPREDSLDVAAFNFYASGNEFDAERSTEIGVGDFDGDGRDDLLLATGRQWFYSSAGKTEWRFLMAAGDRIGSLRFGEFDGLPGTDVFVKDGNRWLFASAGRVWWQQLNTDSTPLTDLLFGDFDGDGRTDVLKADGTGRYISYGARGPWVRVSNSPVRAANLRVGDFDGDGHEDVFALVGGYWAYSRDAQSPWTLLTVALSTDLSSLVFRDFDGDGRTDAARTADGVWQYASGGQGGWLTLTTPPAVYRSFDEVFFGNFTGDRKCDAVRFERATAPVGGSTVTVIGPNLVAWRGLGASDWVRHSWHEMR